MSEGLAQGPYVAARVGFEPVTFGRNAANLLLKATLPHSFLVIAAQYKYLIAIAVIISVPPLIQVRRNLRSSMPSRRQVSLWLLRSGAVPVDWADATAIGPLRERRPMGSSGLGAPTTRPMESPSPRTSSTPVKPEVERRPTNIVWPMLYSTYITMTSDERYCSLSICGAI